MNVMAVCMQVLNWLADRLVDLDFNLILVSPESFQLSTFGNCVSGNFHKILTTFEKKREFSGMKSIEPLGIPNHWMLY